jgi:hypothetical protein
VSGRQHLKPGISQLQPRHLVVGVGRVLSLSSALIGVPAVFFEPIRRNDLLRVFEQSHNRGWQRSNEGHGSKMCPVLIS